MSGSVLFARPECSAVEAGDAATGLGAGRLFTLALLIVGLMACGSGRDDDGEEGEGEIVLSHTIEGVVLGGTEGGEPQALTGYTVCVDLDRTWTCEGQDPEQARTETEEDGTFELEVELAGEGEDITDYAVIAEPGATSGQAGVSSGIVGVAGAEEQYSLSSWLREDDLDDVAVTPFTTLIQEQRQVTDRSVEHLEQRLAAALGVPDADLGVDYSGGSTPLTGGRDLAGGLDEVLRRLQSEALSSEAGWSRNPGAVRNLIADRAFYYAGVVAEGELGAAVGVDDLGFEDGVYDLGLAGEMRGALQELDEEAEAQPGQRYPDNPYLLWVGRDSSNLGIHWRAVDVVYEDGEPAAYGLSEDGVPADGGAEPVLELSPGDTEDLPWQSAARGVTCELDDPIRLRLSFAGRLLWPTHHLIGGDRWRLASVAMHDLVRAEHNFERPPERYMYRGGFSCHVDDPGELGPDYVDGYLEPGDPGTVVLEEDVSAEGWGDWLPELETIGAAADEAAEWGVEVGSWTFLTKEEVAPEFRGLVALDGDHEGVYRYETLSEGGERFLYIDATPSGSPYGYLLRLIDDKILAREYLLHGTSNKDLWLLDERATEDLAFGLAE